MQAELHLDLAPDFVGPEALRAQVRVVDGLQREISITVHRPGGAVPIADLVLGLEPESGELRVLLSAHGANGEGCEHRLCLFPVRPAADAVCPI